MPPPLDVDSYTCEKELGRGSFGRVELCKKAGESVALKFIATTKKHAYEKEARVLAKATTASAFLPRLLGSTSTSAHFVIATEFVPGHHLGYFIERVADGRIKSVPKESMVKLLETAGSALAALHAAGLAHRDVKFDNLIVRGGVIDDDGRMHFDSSPAAGLVLIDLGNACDNSGEDRCVGYGGSPLYNAPQLVGELPLPVDAFQRGDCWSLAYTLTILSLGKFVKPAIGSKDEQLMHSRSLDVFRAIVASTLLDWITKIKSASDKYYLYADDRHVNTVLSTVVLQSDVSSMLTAKEMLASLKGGVGAWLSWMSSPLFAFPGTRTKPPMMIAWVNLYPYMRRAKKVTTLAVASGLGALAVLAAKKANERRRQFVRRQADLAHLKRM